MSKEPTDLQRVRSLLKGFSRTSIAVIGDLILDEFVWGTVERISPEAPVPVVEVTRESERLGGAANVALNLRALGSGPKLVGIVGEDSAGERLLQALKRDDIAPDFVVRSEKRRTTVKTRIIAHHQQVCRADRESKAALDSEARERLLAAAFLAIDGADAVILSDYAKGALDREAIAAIITRCREGDKFIAIDPKVDDFSLYRGASIITPNKKEAERSIGFKIEDESELVKAGNLILEAAGIDYLLITRGDEGMTLFEAGQHLHIPTAAQEVFDVTGAGDTVIATFALSVAAGGSAQEAATLANHAAGVVVAKVGTASANIAELLQSMQAKPSD